MHRIAVAVLALVVAVLSGGCGASTSWILSPEGCTDKETVDAVLHVDPGDDRWLWGVDRTTGADIPLRVPGGYGETTDDPPALITPAGASFGRTGDRIVSGCRDIVQDALMIDETDVRPPEPATP